MVYYEVQNLYQEHISKEDLIVILDLLVKDNDIFLEYGGILHDRDIVPFTGEVKKPHFHVYIGVKDKECKELLYQELELLNVHLTALRSIDAFSRYLIHFDNREKYQYEWQDIFSSHLERVLERIPHKIIGDTLNDVLEQFVINVENGNIRTPFHIVKYFREINKLDYYAKNRRAIEEIFTFYQNINEKTIDNSSFL